MKQIKLNKNKIALIDDVDLELTSKYKWYLHTGSKKPYVYTNDGKGNSLLLHRLITSAPKGKVVDHINGNGLDNRRNNLRICSISENLVNQGPQKNNKSGVKGVSWNMGQWLVQVKYKNKRVYAKRFKSLEQAREAYKIIATKYYGRYIGE